VFPSTTFFQTLSFEY